MMEYEPRTEKGEVVEPTIKRLIRNLENDNPNKANTNAAVLKKALEAEAEEWALSE